MATVAAPDIYKIQLPQFEGPFDLLLFFIERDELDIHDIPISQLTKDFLDYVKTLEALNIEVAAEFILVAATLMKIKAKMLIPRPVINEDGEIEDPRLELVKRLLEYKRYKSVLDDLQVLEQNSTEKFVRGFTKKEEKLILKSEYPEEELMGIDLYLIMKTFRKIMVKHQENMQKPRHVIRKYPYSMDQLKDNLITKLMAKDKVDFVSFILEVPDKIYAVFGFLACLELCQQQVLEIVVGEGFNNFWLVKAGN